MFANKKLAIFAVLVMIAPIVLAACGPTPAPVVQTVVVEQTKVVQEQATVVVKETQQVVVKETQIVEVTPTPAPSTRTGGWLDTMVFTSQDSAEAAVKQIQAGDIDIYAYTVAEPPVFETVKADPKLSYSSSVGSYNELTFNPAGPTFNDGRLNPFSVPKVREAMNWLIDRNYIVQEIFGGLAVVKFMPTSSMFPDYVRYIDTARALEVKYAYNPDKAKQVIGEEMGKLGATLGADGKWQFNGAPVVIIAIIRTEDKRREIGDYVSNQLETIGFTVDRQYKTRSEASPIWNQSDPKEGKMHFYTGGWISTAISRDDSTNFGYFYTNLGSASPLWQAYVNTPEFFDVANKLWINDFKTMDERKALWEKALPAALEDSVRLWLVDQISFSPMRADMSVAYDLAGGVAGAAAYPYTIRFKDKEGGTVRIAQPGILVEPWNPIAGSNWIYDGMPQDAVQDPALMTDPYTGLMWPNRVEKADVVVKEGLPVAKTLDWINLKFAPKIEVPGDAWVDWDAKTQKFITAAEKFTQTVEANTKVTLYYAKDLFQTVKWHDGSPISVGDFVMCMIMTFDPGKPDSPIYDEAQAPNIESFLSHFKGVKIVSTDPLVIETYDDTFALDAEWMIRTWYPADAPLNPGYTYGTAPWQVIALGVMADSKGELAFSTDKAGAKQVEWLSYIAGPSLDILSKHLNQEVLTPTLVYTPTLSAFITPEETAARWASLKKWFSLQGHFWLGTGPYWLDKAFPIEKTLTLRRFEAFPDPANKWAGFGTPMIAVVEVDGPGQVKIGEEATYDVFITFEGNPYPAAQIDAVKYLVFDSAGANIATGDATAAEEGHYTVTLSKDVTAKLAAGSNKLEVVVTSKAVSIPTITDYEFVTQ